MASNINLTTPRKNDIGTRSDHHSGSSSKANDPAENKAAYEQWMDHHVPFEWRNDCHGKKGTIEAFIDEYVPSNEPSATCDASLLDTLSGLAEDIPKSGLETKTYTSIIRLLAESQQGFDQRHTIKFKDTHSQKFAGPTSYDHYTEPDIVGAYPGRKVPAQTETIMNQAWGQISLVVECKMGRDVVDIKKEKINRNEEDERTVSQIIYNARNMLFASSRLFVFVMVICCKTQQMRIYRVDRSGLVSCGFDYGQKPQIIRKFLWRLVHPRHNIRYSIVGADETIRIPSQKDIDGISKEIRGTYPDILLKRDECRFVKVRLDPATCRSLSSSPQGDAPINFISPDGKAEPYITDGLTFGNSLFKASGLFSRATHVTRILVKVYSSDGSSRYFVFVLKNAWHQQARIHESVFYERIQKRYPQLKKTLDTTEYTWVKEALSKINNDPNFTPGLADHYGYLDLSTLDPNSQSEYLGHITVTSRLRHRGKDKWERTLCRSLTGPVGGNLVDFGTTKEIATALRDAIVGHFIAYSCGVLHRDISSSNILVANRSAQLSGFLHDFDYAMFIACDLDTAEEKPPVRTAKDDKKDLTGAPQFLASELLDDQLLDDQRVAHKPHHDLESFYWVFIWILLRHTEHERAEKNNACQQLFDHIEAYKMYSTKSTWLLALPTKPPLTIKGNARLNALLEDVREIFRTYYTQIPQTLPTHRSVVECLNKHIEAEDWPTDDSKREYVRPLNREPSNKFLKTFTAATYHVSPISEDEGDDDEPPKAPPEILLL
ncbi:hypothetical protein BDQ17DRAFT_1419106 [Cyathus striatus]|nr:hypothetical protein BDQ17DRAFT_1419106 [Cyathus striatus]